MRTSLKKYVFFLLLCIVIFYDTGRANCTNISAEQHVKDFYRWYITERMMSKNPLDDDIIEKYVNRCVVQNVRILYLRWYFDVDYFTKSQDTWKEWRDILVVHAATKINDTTSIVPISCIFSQDRQHNLVVFVENTNRKYRITKVVGTSVVAE